MTRSLTLRAGLTLGLPLVLSALSTPAYAGIDDYPTAIAGCRHYPLDGSPPFVGNLKQARENTLVDPWTYINRNCTSFVAWRLYTRNGMSPVPGGYSNAGNWGSAAQNTGYTVNSTPAVGAVAWWSASAIPKYGHVAWVEAVNGSNITVEEYNYPSASNGYQYYYYGERIISAGSPTGYIHFKDMPLGGTGYEEAFQANTGYLFTYGSSATNTQQGMMSGTSPAISALSGGGYEMAFQANTGNLFIYGFSQNADTQQGMMAGTSPAIAASPSGGFRVAFQANSGYLFTHDSVSGTTPWGQGMMSGTSPSIAALPNGGYEMAFQANTGHLIVYGDSQCVDTQQGMMAGTSPSIAASPYGGFRVAFQANNGNLYTYDSASGSLQYSLGLKSGTSPSIAALSSGGYVMAFQVNTGNLYTYITVPIDTQQGMMAATSPAITTISGGGFQVAFQNNTGYLYVYNSSTGTAAYNQGMMAGTSPAIAP